MITEPDTRWQAEFGISAGRSSAFFASKDDLDSRDRSVSYSHVVRRAFDLLGLNGVLCDASSPIVYFKVVRSIRPADLVELHRRFWNHGEAPILAVVSPNEVQIYSGLARPIDQADSRGQWLGLVTTIDRASLALREFLPAVESGEFFRTHSRSFKLNERVDYALLDNLRATREKLVSITENNTAVDILDAFLCRLVFTCYLFDRSIVGEGYLRRLGFFSLSHLRDILGIKPRSEAKTALYRLFRKLATDFNGDLFSDDLTAEGAVVSAAHIAVVDAFFRGTDVTSGQQAFWPYDFGAIPIETISAIYERFLKASDKKTGAFYTPRFLAELVLDMGLAERSSLLKVRCLDPACGSGIF
jgi:N-6 DNA Methylase